MDGMFTETIQQSFNTELGKYGESIVIQTLKDMGYNNIDYVANIEPYSPYDFIIKINNVKYLCDVKTKKRREYYEDTGIDKRTFIKFYNLMNDKNNIKLFFVDFHDKQKKIYSLNFNEYYSKAIEHKEIMYWSINKYMIKLRDLSDDEVKICNLYRCSSF